MDSDPIRVFVVDDHPMIRSGLAAMIRATRDFQWVGEAGAALEALRLARAVHADVVLMDLHLPDLDGIEAARLLLRDRARLQVIVLTGTIEPAQVRAAVDAGAMGFVSKTVSAHELEAAIRGVHAGRRMLSQEAIDALANARRADALGEDLTTREREVLAAAARGLNNLAIAEELVIAVPTVKFHITNILAKLHVESRTEAVLIAIRHKLVDML